MRLPLLVVSRLAAHNLLATHGMTVSVPEGSERGAEADAADVPDLLSCLFAAQQRRVDKFHEFRRCALLLSRARGSPAGCAARACHAVASTAARPKLRHTFRCLYTRSGFDALLVDGNMGEYNAVCTRVAGAFKDISAEVNAVGASLRAAGREDLCEAVRTLQQQEKEQLRLVRASDV
jgi:hypothetical protein